jgi:Trypsin-co-occurring domain 2
VTLGPIRNTKPSRKAELIGPAASDRMVLMGRWRVAGMAEGSEVGLAAALEALRDELEAAWSASRGRKVRFRAAELTVTVETVARLDKDGSGKIRWWLVEAGGGVKSGRERTQTLTLMLTPLLYDEAGQLVPLDIDAAQSVPGR